MRPKCGILLTPEHTTYKDSAIEKRFESNGWITIHETAHRIVGEDGVKKDRKSTSANYDERGFQY